VSPGWSALVAAIAAAVLVLAFMVWWRWRTLVRTPGTFTARARPADERGAGTLVIGRYDEAGLDLMTVWSIDPRPRWKAARHQLRLRRGAPGRQDGSVVVRVDGGPAPIDLDIHTDDCSGLSAWIEAGPAVGFGTWREMPSRRPRASRGHRASRRRAH
jgi:hypothetical protein